MVIGGQDYRPKERNGDQWRNELPGLSLVSKLVIGDKFLVSHILGYVENTIGQQPIRRQDLFAMQSNKMKLCVLMQVSVKRDNITELG